MMKYIDKINFSEKQKATIEELKQYKWDVTWSGGKDSTATLILMHELDIPIGNIYYVEMMYDDTVPATLPIITNFVNNAEKILESWGYVVHHIPSYKTAKEIISQCYKRSSYTERNNKPYGITAFSRGHCKFTDVKTKTIKMIDISEYQMIGYAADEFKRLHRLNNTTKSIMVELGIVESEAFEICKMYNLLSPLYDFGLKRGGCWFCPNCSRIEKNLIKSQYPNLYKKINDMIEMCEYDLTNCIPYNHWLDDYYKIKK